jgi:hypothetical protein
MHLVAAALPAEPEDATEALPPQVRTKSGHSESEAAVSPTAAQAEKSPEPVDEAEEQRGAAEVEAALRAEQAWA